MTEPTQPSDSQTSATDPQITPAPPAPPAPETLVQNGEPIAPISPGPVAVTEKRRHSTGLVVGALVAGAVLGGASGAGVAAWAVSMNSHGGSTAATPQTITVNNPGSVNAVTAVAAKASPSVVTINVTATSAGGTGSGVVLSSDGYVLTNTHVVTLDGVSSSGTIEVTTADGRLFSAKVIGTDPIVDLAVIKLDNASGLQPIEFADSGKLNVGDHVVAIGAPLGLSNTVTEGIVSALNRSIQIASSAVPKSSSSQDGSTPAPNATNGPFDFWNFGQNPNATPTGQSSTISLPVIQTDAAINPGNSGGALVNDQGQLIGINVAIASTGSSSSTSQSGSIGVGFAIPANLADRISKEIIASGTATHGLLGASVKDATSSDSSTVGAIVASVTAGGAAEAAGIQPNDVITVFNGVPITGSTDLTAQVRALPSGSSATLTYQRGGNPTTVTVTLGKLK